MNATITPHIRTDPIATLVYDRDTLGIVSASERAAMSLGYSRDELLALSLVDLHPVDDAPGALDVLRSASGPIRLGAQPGPPWRLARRDGSIAEVEIESDEIEPAGRACRFLIWQERRDADARDPGELEAFELRSVLIDACASAVSHARAKRVALDVDLAPDVPEWVLGHPGRLHTALEQLVHAAIAATTAGGVAVCVRLRGSTRSGALVRIEVSDTGLGVEPAIVANAASPDVRTDAHAHASIALGRASALFASLGATIESLREPGLGSFVWVDVPLRNSRFSRAASSAQEGLGELRAAA